MAENYCQQCKGTRYRAYSIEGYNSYYEMWEIKGYDYACECCGYSFGTIYNDEKGNTQKRDFKIPSVCPQCGLRINNADN